MESITLDVLIAQTRAALEPFGHSPSTQWQYDYAWRQFRQYASEHTNKPLFHRNWLSGMFKRSWTNTGMALCHHGSLNYFAGRSYCSSNAARRATSVGGPYRHTTHPS